MSVLLLSSDNEAGRMLSSALSRCELPFSWFRALRPLEELPLVTVIDAELDGYERLLSDLTHRAPWNRSYLLTRRGKDARASTARVVQKPFDAAGLAQALRGDYQLAELERRRRSETHQLEAELQHSQRLAHLGRIAATMSHEINNPLAVIRSCTAWLEQYATDQKNDDLAETVKDLELASERIVGFVDQIGGFARKGGANLRAQPLAKTMELALRMVKPRAVSKHVQLAFARTPRLLSPVVHDSSRIAQAIINVVANAVDAAADGGGRVWIDVVNLSPQVRIIISDDGPGVPEDLKQKVFEHFMTTKPHGQGTGLGLSLTREILLEHGGDVLLSDRPRGGTVVELLWPAQGADDSSAQGAPCSG